MHSLIFQISEKPVRRSEWKTPEDYDDCLPSFADYVQEFSGNVTAAHEELARSIGTELCIGGRVRITKEVKEKYFLELQNRLRSFLEKHPFPDRHEDVSGHATEIRLREAGWIVSGELNDWRVDWDGDVTTVTEFMRTVTPDADFYLGGIVDYHM